MLYNKKIWPNKFYLYLLLWILMFISTSQLLASTHTQITKQGAYVSEQKFNSDYHMATLFSQITTNFEIEDWKVDAAQLTLQLSTTQILDCDLSTLTFTINDVKFYSEKIPLTNGERRVLELTIPKEYLIKGTNTLKIEGYIRTPDGLPCVDDVSPANWLNVFSDSFISIKYWPLQKVHTISDFYSLFSNLTAIDYDQSCIAFSDSASNKELSAATEALAYMSKQMKKNYEMLDFLPVKDETMLSNKQYIIYVDKLPSSYLDLLSDSQKETAKKDALIALITTKEHQNVLIITSQNEEKLSTAVKVLGNSTLAHQLTSADKVVNEFTDIINSNPSVNDYAYLTENGLTLEGAFRQYADFYINIPAGKTLASGSKVSLDFRYSENLNFDRSLVTLYINGTPIGSRKLYLDKANNDSLTLDIPTDLKITGSFTLTIAFDLEVQDLWCTLRLRQMPWAYIIPSSAVKINTSDITFTLFEYYPAPFVKGTSFNDIVVLVPDKKNDSVYTCLSDVFRTLGRSVTSNEGSIEIRNASEPLDLTDKNIISIGCYKDNAFTLSLNNEQLYFKCSDDNSYILTNEKISLDPNYASNLGSVQLIKASESDVWKNALIITGVSENGMVDAASYLGYEEGLWHLYGDGYIAVGEDLSIYRFKKDNNKKVSFTTTTFKTPELLTFIVFASMTLLLIVISIVLLILKHKKARNSHEKE